MSAFNGAGTFVISGAGLPFVTGTTISSTVANQLNTDLATGLSLAICKDGQSTPTANLPMGGFKITGLNSPGAAAGDALCQQMSTTATFLGTVAAAYITVNGAGGGTVAFTGFGRTRTDGYTSILTNSGNPFQVCNDSTSVFAVGVKLVDGASSWAAFSDERQKTDLIPISEGVAKVGALRAVTGRYTFDAPDKSRAFLIAQDVQAVLPEAVSTDKDGMLLLSYTDVVPLLVAAVKELSARVVALGG